MKPHELLKRGGKWLGAAREWLQWNTRNGDSVTWGSDQLIMGQITVRGFEECASQIAAAAMEEAPSVVALGKGVTHPQIDLDYYEWLGNLTKQDMAFVSGYTKSGNDFHAIAMWVWAQSRLALKAKAAKSNAA